MAATRSTLTASRGTAPAAPRQAPRRAMHDEDLYAIFPTVHPNGAKCWFVILSRFGRTIRMTFPHLKYGGADPALAIARACRDAALQVTAPMTNREMRSIVRRNRSGGMPGVYQTEVDARHPAYWIATITLPDGRCRRRSFNILRYGNARAKHLAEAERQKMLDEVENIEAAALRSPAAQSLDLRLGGESMPATPPKPDEGIQRGTSRNAPAWRVRVQLRGLWIWQPFADKTYGGEMQALHVARAYRRAVLAVVPPLAAKDEGAQRRRKLASAIPGVYFRPKRYGRGAQWCACMVLPDGRVRTRWFAVSRHGAEEARRLAEAERIRMLEAESVVGDL